jgi:hypothetical protein
MADLKIQIVSDLHLEMSRDDAPISPVTAPHIALLGDIGRGDSEKYAAFVKDLSSKYTTVLLVASNHEFYNCQYDLAITAIEQLAGSIPNVLFLDRRSVELDGVKIIGCTLWSHVPSACRRAVEGVLNDYRLIRTEDISGNMRPFTVSDTNALHTVDLEFIRFEIERSRKNGQKTLVLTHHAPSMIGTSAPRFEGLPNNHAYATDLEELMGPPVVAWAYGHTHFNDSMERSPSVGGTMLVSNQKGYSREEVGRPFDPGAYLHVRATRATWVQSSQKA